MARSTLDHWQRYFNRQSPMFQTLLPYVEQIADRNSWPGLDILCSLFEQENIDIRPVEQGDRPICFDEHYEPRIYLKKELQTRRENWHDLFNALVWLRFPQTKSVLNELHYHAALKRPEKTNRSALENAITLFDECGMVVISRYPEYLDMIRQHHWQSLFIEHRHAFDGDIRCYVFGHAIYEKALSPYIGMTAQALLIESNTLLTTDVTGIDAALADIWRCGEIVSSKDLSPLPLLGIPGWYTANADAAFYDNTDYFRPKRSR